MVMETEFPIFVNIVFMAVLSSRQISLNSTSHISLLALTAKGQLIYYRLLCYLTECQMWWTVYLL